MTETPAAPANSFPCSDDFYEDPITDEGVDMVIAYAGLPTLTKIRKVILNSAAEFGPVVAAAIAKGLEEHREVRGVRFFNSHPGVPDYSGSHEHDIRAAEAAPAVIPAQNFPVPSPNYAIGGLIWPLPDGKWQYIDIMADGRVEPSTEM